MPDKPDWKLFTGKSETPTDGLRRLPPPPPWRVAGQNEIGVPTPDLDLEAEKLRAAPFLPTEEMIIATNAALYLRRPLLVTGRPGIGKSTLISKVAYELKLGPVIRWPISSRSSVRSGIYEYDAVGRLQASKTLDPPVQDFLRLGPLGTAFVAQGWPRPLLIDEIDKSDLDFANDLLNVFEEGTYEIPELARLKQKTVEVRDYFGKLVSLTDGAIKCGQFPFIVMTSNAEREFPAPLLRRCIRLNIEPPSEEELGDILDAHLKKYEKEGHLTQRQKLLKEFETKRRSQQELATDQLLNAVFLTVSMKDGERSFSEKELEALRGNLLRSLSSS